MEPAFMNRQTTVVNWKVKYIRQQGYKDLKHWCEDPNNVYIARSCVFVQTEEGKKRYPSRDSIWANPFKLGRKGNGPTRDEVVSQYEQHIIQKIQNDNLYDELLLLKGKNLGCWWKEPNVELACHGDVLVRLIEQLETTGSITSITS